MGLVMSKSALGLDLNRDLQKSRSKIMMQDAGLTKISFSEENLYWVAVGYGEKV